MFFVHGKSYDSIGTLTDLLPNYIVINRVFVWKDDDFLFLWRCGLGDSRLSSWVLRSWIRRISRFCLLSLRTRSQQLLLLSFLTTLFSLFRCILREKSRLTICIWSCYISWGLLPGSTFRRLDRVWQVWGYFGAKIGVFGVLAGMWDFVLLNQCGVRRWLRQRAVRDLVGSLVSVRESYLLWREHLLPTCLDL